MDEAETKAEKIEAQSEARNEAIKNRKIQEAKEKKMSGIVWQVLEWNEPAISFYKKYNASFDAEWVNCALTIN